MSALSVRQGMGYGHTRYDIHAVLHVTRTRQQQPVRSRNVTHWLTGTALSWNLVAAEVALVNACSVIHDLFKKLSGRV